MESSFDLFGHLATAKAALDPRHADFIEFSAEQFEFHRDLRLSINGSDVLALKRMLTETAGQEEFTLDRLKLMWLAFMVTKDKFEREQGRPLRYFATNITKFALRLKESSEPHMSPGTNAARQWLRGRLNRNETD